MTLNKDKGGSLRNILRFGFDISCVHPVLSCVVDVVSWISFVYVRYDPVKVFCPYLSNLNAVTFGGKKLWLIC